MDRQRQSQFRVLQSDEDEAYSRWEHDQDLLENLLSTKPDRALNAYIFGTASPPINREEEYSRQQRQISRESNSRNSNNTIQQLSKKCPTKNFPLLLSRRIKKIIAYHIIPILIKDKPEICRKTRQTYYPTTSFWEKRPTRKDHDEDFIIFCVQFTQNTKNSLNYVNHKLKGLLREQQTEITVRLKLNNSKSINFVTAKFEKAEVLTFNSKLKSWILEKEQILLEQCKKDNSNSYKKSGLKTEDLYSYAKKWLDQLKM